MIWFYLLISFLIGVGIGYMIKADKSYNKGRREGALAVQKMVMDRSSRYLHKYSDVWKDLLM